MCSARHIKYGKKPAFRRLDWLASLDDYSHSHIVAFRSRRGEAKKVFILVSIRIVETPFIEEEEAPDTASLKSLRRALSDRVIGGDPGG